MESYLARVEVDASRGLPGFEMVGLLGSEVKEARERIRVALKNAEAALPPVRITVNISPASLHKEGTSYDLPVAVGILVSTGMIPQDYVCLLYTSATCLPENAETGKVKIKWSSTMTNKDIMRIATEQSALEANCSPEDFFRSENIVTISTGNKLSLIHI